MNRRERLEQMGDKMKKFNNVYIKNFSEEIDDEKLKIWFETFGKIISAKVSFVITVKWSIFLNVVTKICERHVWLTYDF